MERKDGEKIGNFCLIAASFFILKREKYFYLFEKLYI